VVDLPINGRNIMSLAGILPGVVGVSVSQNMDNARSGPIMNVNGGRSNMNLFTFNAHTSTIHPAQHRRQFSAAGRNDEVRILTHDFSAEYGHNPGSQVMVASKAAPISFTVEHGSFFAITPSRAKFFRADCARSPPASVWRRRRRRIKKDRCSSSAPIRELINHQQAQSVQAFVPTDAQRGGDFTSLRTTLVNPTDTITGKPLLSPAGRRRVTGVDCLCGMPSVGGHRLLASRRVQSDAGYAGAPAGLSKGLPVMVSVGFTRVVRREVKSPPRCASVGTNA